MQEEELQELYGKITAVVYTNEENGWTEFADVDIMDEDGDTPLPVRGGQWLTEVAVGSHLLNYDSMVVLTHLPKTCRSSPG